MTNIKIILRHHLKTSNLRFGTEKEEKEIGFTLDQAVKGSFLSGFRLRTPDFSSLNVLELVLTLSRGYILSDFPSELCDDSGLIAVKVSE